jgi:predicted flap endonuclease-1-like 5' DNA nuclease/cell division protein FtsB
MKRYYWYVVLFLVWCLASAWWYLYGVKGVKIDPQSFSPQASLTSIIEILTMLLIACLIGYAIAWDVRQVNINDQGEIREKLQSENSSLHHSNNELKEQIEQWRNKYQYDLNSVQHKANEISLERDRLRQKLEELELAISSKQQNSLTSQAQLEQLETETGTLRYRLRQLEFQNKEHEASYAKLKSEFESLQLERKEKPSLTDHPFVRPVEPDEKDNLTAIKGIGPFIEKRLNMIGIYTFKQLSELTPELIDRVGNAIEFFPGRIQRENWIGQAQNFAKS